MEQTSRPGATRQENHNAAGLSAGLRPAYSTGISIQRPATQFSLSPLGEGWGEGNSASQVSALTLTLSRRERGLFH